MIYLPFNQGNPKTQIGVAIVLLLLITAFFTRCAHAEDSYVQMGVGSTIVRGPAPMLDLQLVYPDAGPADSRVEIGTTLIGSSTFRGQWQPSNFAFSAAVIDGLGRLEVGLGGGYLQNTDEYNGSHLNFKLILGYRGDHWGVRWAHFSNAGTQLPNRGRDMVVGYWEFK